MTGTLCRRVRYSYVRFSSKAGAAELSGTPGAILFSFWDRIKTLYSQSDFYLDKQMKKVLVIGGGREHAIVQPGGSVRDEDSVKKADECGITMLCTGMRHFKH